MEINYVIIESAGNRINVEAPYNAYFVDKAKRLGLNHKWDGEKWSFDAAGLAAIRTLAIDAYGDPTPRTGSKNDGRLSLSVDGEIEQFNIPLSEGGSQWMFDKLEAEAQIGNVGYGY